MLATPVRVIADDLKRPDASDRARRITLLCAVVGEASSPSTAIDVTFAIQSRIEDAGGRVLNVDATENLAYVLPDPAPGAPKLLMLRYMIFNRLGELRLRLRADSLGIWAERSVFIEAPVLRPRLLVPTASFGHPADARRMYDVTEVCVWLCVCVCVCVCVCERE